MFLKKKQQKRANRGNIILPPPRDPLSTISVLAGQIWSGNSGMVPTFEIRAEQRVRQSEPESLFRNIAKSYLATKTWLWLWAKESGTDPVERAGRVLCLLWTACEKWEQNQTEEEKVLSFHRSESSRYRIAGLWQIC